VRNAFQFTKLIKKSCTVSDGVIFSPAVKLPNPRQGKRRGKERDLEKREKMKKEGSREEI